MPTSKLLLYSLLSLNLYGLAACNIPSPQLRDKTLDLDGQGVSTFFITDVKGEALPAKLNKSSATPQSKIFNFTVCLKDQAQSKPLIGHPFRIEEIDKELKTDVKGCLNWSEEVAFNFLSTPQYLDWQRKITASGLHRGTRIARFAINPWNENDNSQAVLNLEIATPDQLISEPGQVQAALKGSSKNDPMAKNALWLNNLSLQSTEQKFTSDGVVLNFELMAAPQLQVSKMNGEKMLRSLNQGRFKLKFYLIHVLLEDNKEVHRLLAQSDLQTLEMNGGNLFISFPLKFPRLPTRGQLALGVDISGEGKDTALGNFQGLYTLGDYDQFKGSRFLRLMSVVTENKEFKISSFINSRTDNPKGAYVQPRVEIAPLEFKYLRVGKESTSEREIIYNVKACFKNGLDQKNIRGFTFNVSGFGQNKTSTLTSDNSSCINWDDTLTFKYYECHKQLKGFIEIENKELALKQKIEVVINPWEPSGTFARDLRYVENQENLVTECKKEDVLPAMIALKTISYSTLSNDYEIDHLLNLTVKKKLRFKIDAEVNVLSDLNKGRAESPQRVRPGIYLLKLALIKNRDYYNQKTYITSYEKLIATVNGDLRGDIELKTADLKALKSHDTLLVELAPVKEDKVSVDPDGNVIVKEKVASLDEIIDRSTGLYSRTFSTVMGLGDKSGYLELNPVDSKVTNQYFTNANSANKKLSIPDDTQKSMIREYIKYGEKMAAENLQIQRAQADIALFAKSNSLKKISLQDPQDSVEVRTALAKALPRMNETEIKNLLSQFSTTGKLDEDLSKGLCSYWFNSFITKDLWGFFKSHEALKCALRANRPEQVFTVEKRLFVKELESYRFLNGYSYPIAVGSGITLTKSESHSDSVSKSLDLSLDLNLLEKFAKIFSIGLSGHYSISHSDSEGQANSNSVSMGANISLNMEQNVYQLKFRRYQECATVKINPQQFMKKGLFSNALNPRLKETEKAEIASRGLMICTGVDNTTPLLRNEIYYQLNQAIGDSQIQDNGDLRNINFFIALRGEKEFERLMYFMKGNIKTPQTADRSSDEQKNNFTNLNKLFNTGFTNVPGSYNDTH